MTTENKTTISGCNIIEQCHTGQGDNVKVDNSHSVEVSGNENAVAVGNNNQVTTGKEGWWTKTGWWITVAGLIAGLVSIYLTIK